MPRINDESIIVNWKLSIVNFQLIPYPMDGLKGNARIMAEYLAQAGNKHIHAAANKVTLVFPDRFLYDVAFDDFVPVYTKQAQQFGLLVR